MNNPWEEIPLSDYEKHMSLDSILQLQGMNQMMKEQFASYPVTSAMVLGVAGGNGLEHVDIQKYYKVYGIDINADYLSVVKVRYQNLKDILECLCISHVTAWCASDNIASSRALEKAGMRLSGINAGGLEVGGERYDKLDYTYSDQESE